MIVVLGLTFLLSLFLIPHGLPGIWLMLLATAAMILFGAAVKISWFVLGAALI